MIRIGCKASPYQKMQSGYKITQLYSQKVTRNPYQSKASRVIKHNRSHQYSIKSKIVACDSQKQEARKERTLLSYSDEAQQHNVTKKTRSGETQTANSKWKRGGC